MIRFIKDSYDTKPYPKALSCATPLSLPLSPSLILKPDQEKTHHRQTRVYRRVAMALLRTLARQWAPRLLRTQENRLAGSLAVAGREYKTTTGIVGVEVDENAPETLRHMLKQILRVSVGRGERRNEGPPPPPTLPRLESELTLFGSPRLLTVLSPLAVHFFWPASRRRTDSPHPTSQEIKVVPENAQYRVSVEIMAKERLSVVEKDISPEQVSAPHFVSPHTTFTPSTSHTLGVLEPLLSAGGGKFSRLIHRR